MVIDDNDAIMDNGVRKAFFMEAPMRYLLFFLALNVGACAASGAAHMQSNSADDTQTKALAQLGIRNTGTGYVGDRLVSVKCAISQGDAFIDSKTVRRLAHDDLVKLYCASGRVEALIPERIDIVFFGDVSCIKFVVKVSGIKCQPGQ
jgi:hypothetical protein